jgi:TRAP-type C4-dicarboxylate transport system permease small subunit
MITPGLSRRTREGRQVLVTLGNRLRKGVRQVHRMFEVLVGLSFFVLAAFCISLSFTQWHRYQTNPSGGLSLFYMFASFSLVLVFCGLYSFVKARSIR